MFKDKVKTEEALREVGSVLETYGLGLGGAVVVVDHSTLGSFLGGLFVAGGIVGHLMKDRADKLAVSIEDDKAFLDKWADSEVNSGHLF
jgi:hypothetical protein